MINRIKAFGIEIDPLTMSEAVDECLAVAGRRGNALPYVVTPNIDHIVNLQGNAPFQSAYVNAALVLTDGKPVRLALSMLGHPVKEVVPGSDLVPAMFSKISSQGLSLTVFLLGAAPGVAERAAEVIHDRWKGVSVVGTYSPPHGFEHELDENRKIVGLVNEANPDVLIIGLGAPKQELWVCNNFHELHAGIGLCVGATIDFFAGAQVRAPEWMRNLGLEWLHRMLSQPRRLMTRYAKGAITFPILVLREFHKCQR